MGQKVSEQTLGKYIEQLSKIKMVYRETVTEFLERISDTVESARFPYDAFYVLDQRCSFIEAVLLNRHKSHVRTFLDQMDQCVVIGLEQSVSFSGKNSVFCAFRADDANHYSDIVSTMQRRLIPKAGVPMCSSFQEDGSVIGVAPVSAFILPKN